MAYFQLCRFIELRVMQEHVRLLVSVICCIGHPTRSNLLDLFSPDGSRDGWNHSQERNLPLKSFQTSKCCNSKILRDPTKLQRQICALRPEEHFQTMICIKSQKRFYAGFIPMPLASFSQSKIRMLCFQQLVTKAVSLQAESKL